MDRHYGKNDADALPRKKLLLRSSWQTVNIGDIAHTPGLLALLETFLPEIEVYLWPMDVSHGVREMLLARFPGLHLVEDDQSLLEAFGQCDILLHGSGPYLVAQEDLNRWRFETGKPYGVCGITLGRRRSSQTQDIDDATINQTISTLNHAEFVYFRDSVSLDFARQQGCVSPVMDFCPDAAFACDLRADRSAEAFLQEQRLEPDRFLCCIPRLRYTPGWEFSSKNKAVDPVKVKRNQQMKLHDHEPLLDSIQRVVNETSLKVLICPEDETQVKLGREMLLDPLPVAVRRQVVWRENFWLTSEAMSVFRRSAGLFGHEMHSPIMCIAQGIPAIVCRWSEQSSKGIMWRDIGLGDWLFDLDLPDERAEIAPAVLALALDPPKAKTKAQAAKRRVLLYQTQAMSRLRVALGLPGVPDQRQNSIVRSVPD